jgi:hypothetical protein
MKEEIILDIINEYSSEESLYQLENKIFTDEFNLSNCEWFLNRFIDTDKGGVKPLSDSNNKKDIISKWVLMGLLNNLEGKKKVICAIAYEIARRYILAEQGKVRSIQLNETMIFPVIRRIINKNDIDSDNLIDVVKDIVEDFSLNLIMGIEKLKIECNHVNYIDYEVEYASNYCDNYKIKQNEPNNKQMG